MPDTPNVRPEPSLQDGSDALAPGTRLGEFEIRETIGAGGFGIVYRAWDEALQRDVALKEYMPVSLAGRGGGERVTLRSRMNEETFALGLQSFVNEARLLARFDQPGLVKVFRFWEGNGTAYMAMPLYHGRTLRQLRKDVPADTFDDAWLRALVFPLLGALEVMHNAEVYHRDIAPDNILWCDDGRPVLLDFGAARLVLADRTQNVTAVLKPQFAPIEQYAETQSMRQGPWTDLYALAGTCYFMLTGRAPVPATARVITDELVPLARQALPGCSKRMLEMLDWAMAVRPQDRPQSVAEFREALSGRLHVPDGAFDPTAIVPPPGAAGSFDKTMQATMKMTSPAGTPAPAHARAAGPRPARRPRDDDEPDAIDDKPERSVMLPPKSRSPLKAVVLLALLAGVVGGGWAMRDQWMPMLQGTPLAKWLPAPAASSASVADASASGVAGDASAPAATPLANSASAPATRSSEAVVAANDAAASAAEAAAAPPEPVASTPEEIAAERAARTKAAKAAKAAADRRLEAKLAAIPLPPPVLPPPAGGTAPANASAAPAAATAKPAAEAAPSAEPGAGPVSNLRSLGGPRELCKDGEPAQVAACVKNLCDNDKRYRRYPVCLRIHKQEEAQGQ